MKGPIWNRIAAATGLDFAVAALAFFVLAQVEGHAGVGELALESSNAMWATAVLVCGLAGALFAWFTGTFVARLRQLELETGESGRLPATVAASGAVIAGLFLLEVVVQFAARNAGERMQDLAVLATSVLEGPAIAFAAAAYVAAAGLVAIRNDALPRPSEIVGRLSLPLAAALVLLAALQLYNNYAWIDETIRLSFLAWVAAVSAIGVARWADMEGDAGPERPLIRAPERVVQPPVSVAAAVPPVAHEIGPEPEIEPEADLEEEPELEPRPEPIPSATERKRPRPRPRPRKPASRTPERKSTPRTRKPAQRPRRPRRTDAD